MTLFPFKPGASLIPRILDPEPPLNAPNAGSQAGEEASRDRWPRASADVAVSLEAVLESSDLQGSGVLLKWFRLLDFLEVEISRLRREVEGYFLEGAIHLVLNPKP